MVTATPLATSGDPEQRPARDEKYPEGLEERHLRPSGSALRAWLPLIIPGLVLLSALLGLFGGGRSPWVQLSAPAATMSIHTPRILRSGFLFETQVVVIARRDLEDATIGVSPQLWRDMTINSTLPEPGEQEFRGGLFRFRYGPLKAGDRIEMKIDGQVNPPLVGGGSGEVALFDGGTKIASIPLRVRVLP